MVRYQPFIVGVCREGLGGSLIFFFVSSPGINLSGGRRRIDVGCGYRFIGYRVGEIHKGAGAAFLEF